MHQNHCKPRATRIYSVNANPFQNTHLCMEKINVQPRNQFKKVKPFNLLLNQKTPVITVLKRRPSTENHVSLGLLMGLSPNKAQCPAGPPQPSFFLLLSTSSYFFFLLLPLPASSYFFFLLLLPSSSFFLLPNLTPHKH